MTHWIECNALCLTKRNINQKKICYSSMHKSCLNINILPIDLQETREIAFLKIEGWKYMRL